MTAEELRKELLENILKKRIFYADRIEKVEKVLFAHLLIPKDQIYCSDEQLESFKASLNEELLEKIYTELAMEKEEIWFDIYRSISSLSSAEQSEKEKKKQQRVERRRRRLLKQKHELRQKRI